jgi:hypothetical protein
MPFTMSVAAARTCQRPLIELDPDVTQRADLIYAHFPDRKLKVTPVIQRAGRRDLDLPVALPLWAQHADLVHVLEERCRADVQGRERRQLSDCQLTVSDGGPQFGPADKPDRNRSITHEQCIKRHRVDRKRAVLVNGKAMDGEPAAEGPRVEAAQQIGVGGYATRRAQERNGRPLPILEDLTARRPANRGIERRARILRRNRESNCCIQRSLEAHYDCCECDQSHRFRHTVLR